MEADFLTYLRNYIRVRPRRVLITTALCLIVSLIAVRFYEPTYHSTATLMVRDEQQSGSMNSVSVFMGGLSALQKDSFILSLDPLVRSGQVFTAVKQRMKSDDTWHREFELTPSSPVIDRIKEMLFGPDYLASQQFVDREFIEFGKRISFSSSLDAGTFNIAFESKNPEIALKVNSYLVEELTRYQLQIENQQYLDALKFLQAKEKEVTQEWDEVSTRIVERMTKEGLPLNEELMIRQLLDLADLKKEILLKSADRAAVASSLAAMEQSAQAVSAIISSGKAVSSSALQGLIAEISRLEQQNALVNDQTIKDKIVKLRQRFQENIGHDGLDQESGRQVRAILEEQKAKLQSTLAGSTSALNTLQQGIEKIEGSLENILMKETGMKKLLLQREILLQLLKLVSEVKLTTLMSSETAVSKMAVINHPQLVPHALTSSKSKLLLLSVLSLSFFGYLAFCTLEFMKGVIYDRSQCKDLRDIVNIGLMPSLDYPHMIRFGLKDPWITSALGVIHNRYIKGTKNLRIFVTSHGEGDGKSTLASLLATTLAERGLNTLLVDGDIYGKKRAARTIFSQMARDPISIVGDSPTKLRENLDAVRMTLNNKAQYVDKKKQEHTVTIIDCPPAEFIGDFTFTAGDLVIICVREASTTVQQIETVKNLVLNSSTDAPRFACLLTHVKLSENLQKKSYGNYVAA